MATELIELEERAVYALEKIGKITGKRTLPEVLSDALRTYAWILKEQAAGKAIVAVNGAAEKQVKLDNFVQDKVEAVNYLLREGGQQ